MVVVVSDHDRDLFDIRGYLVMTLARWSMTPGRAVRGHCLTYLDVPDSASRSFQSARAIAHRRYRPVCPGTSLAR